MFYTFFFFWLFDTFLRLFYTFLSLFYILTFLTAILYFLVSVILSCLSLTLSDLILSFRYIYVYIFCIFVFSYRYPILSCVILDSFASIFYFLILSYTSLFYLILSYLYLLLPSRSLLHSFLLPPVFMSYIVYSFIILFIISSCVAISYSYHIFIISYPHFLLFILCIFFFFPFFNRIVCFVSLHSSTEFYSLFFKSSFIQLTDLSAFSPFLYQSIFLKTYLLDLLHLT